ncbi:MAG: hypothetical protein ACLSV2_11640 [Clostridium sp.]
MAKLLIWIISMPVIIALIFAIIYPEKNLMFGRRWQYKNKDLEPSEAAIKYTRISSIIFVIILIALTINIGLRTTT